ncbi:MAG: thioredoxin [Planctomycetota bacterium]
MANATVLEFTDANFDSEVINSDKPVLVDFWAEWCQPCRMLAPTIDAVADTMGEQVKVGKLDIDSNRDVAAKFGIQSIPTLLIFKNGQAEKKFVGLTPQDQIETAMNELLA